MVSGAILSASPALAMHIGEGILPIGHAALWYALSAPFVMAGLWKLKGSLNSDINAKPLIGMVGAAVFVISCMPVPVPVAGTCSHPAGTAMAALLVGPLGSIVASAAALLLQALFLTHGGISTWGANIFSMGVVGSFSGWLAFRICRKSGASLGVSAFFAGLAGDWLTYATTAFQLAFGLHGPGEFMPLFVKILIGFMPTQIPLGILEGFMTAGAVKFLYGRRPEVFRALSGERGAGAGANA
jgi:cobalt/nickel transport system permease protein